MPNKELFCLNRTTLVPYRTLREQIEPRCRRLVCGRDWMNPHRQVHVCSTSRVAVLGEGLEKVRVLELCRKACPGCCCLAKTAPAKQKTDDRERGSWNTGLSVPSVLCLCLPSRGVNRIWLPYCAWYYPRCSMVVVPPFVLLCSLLYHQSRPTHAHNCSSPICVKTCSMHSSTQMSLNPTTSGLCSPYFCPCETKDQNIYIRHLGELNPQSILCRYSSLSSA